MVLAETAKNSPDSYGGKLESNGVFSSLVNDVLNTLKENHRVKKKCSAGNIILAGHSGAYRLIANIIKNGAKSIKEVILFDALYAETEKFISWIKENNNHQFINIYTNGGGTYKETEKMINSLKIENIAFEVVEESQLSPAILNSNTILFIHSLHGHNEIIFHPDNFKLFLENAVFQQSLSK